MHLKDLYLSHIRSSRVIAIERRYVHLQGKNPDKNEERKKYKFVHLKGLHLSLMKMSRMRVRSPRPEKATEGKGWNKWVDCS